MVGCRQLSADVISQAVKKEYRNAILGVCQVVEFEAEAISLDIPMEGKSIKGWKITPLRYPMVSSCGHHIHPCIATNFPHWLQPQVTKKQVDNFREGKLTPCCQLLAEFETYGEEKKISKLKHRVNLKGAKYPNDVFVINLPARGRYILP